jgi:hypothetical protein
MPFTSPRLNAVSTVARFMFGGCPTHFQIVGVYYALRSNRPRVK